MGFLAFKLERFQSINDRDLQTHSIESGVRTVSTFQLLGPDDLESLPNLFPIHRSSTYEQN